ncbi:ATP synthase F1 subunit delta [bacterium]|nr:ATP synthase F1 subunit delta [bacterium]
MSEIVAKRWASALIDLTKEDESLTSESILQNLKDVSDTFNSSEELKNAINNPSVSVEEKQIVLSKLYQGKISPIIYNFLYVLNLKKRLNIINEIADEYEKETERLNNIVRVDITSAIEIDEDKKQELKSKIENKIHKEIKADWKINNEIIAGLVFDINGTVVDNSIKHKLVELSENIIKNA